MRYQNFHIEHTMPQSIDDVPIWEDMLGKDWEEIHKTWLHRLGNLTLTTYGSAYSNRPFEEKKTITEGFEQSAVRPNGYVREQAKWTACEMEERATREGLNHIGLGEKSSSTDLDRNPHVYLSFLC